MANRAAGKGYENEDNYSNIRFQFVGIENIHVMRSSLQKLLEGTIIACLLGSFIQQKHNACHSIKFKVTCLKIF